MAASPHLQWDGGKFVPKLREQARSLIALGRPWLVDEVDETVHGLGVVNLVREVAVDAARGV